MKKLFWILFLAFIAVTSSAQTGIEGEEAIADSIDAANDSTRLAQAMAELAEARLNEANMRLELETYKFEQSHSDSLRRAELKHRIDSLRSITQGAPVVIEGDTLFVLYTKAAGMSAPMRAELAQNEINKLGRMYLSKPDSVYIDATDIMTDVMYGNEVIVSFSDRDGLWAGCSREQLASDARQIIVDKIKQLKEKHGIWQLIRRGISLVFILISVILLFKLINYGYRKLRRRIVRLRRTRMRPICIQNYELLDTKKQVGLLVVCAKALKYVMMLLVLILMVPLVFSLFPQTKDLAYRILSYILDPALSILKGIVAYIPNLFTIFVICFCVRYLVRLFKYFAQEIEAERLKINGFYPDWAKPTYYIIRFLLYAFNVAMIYPYLPGSDSGIFQGISVFVGLIVSLGSSTVIGNIIAGLVITYMRPFKMGDRIQLNDTTGNVIEKTPLVTRIRTPKNEIVTVPNSFIMSSQTVNYSESAHQYGLIIHTEVTIGYDAPWRQVNQLLIDAALNTPGVVDDPRPFVLETSLSDWYPVYQLNAYIRDANKMGEIYSNLHQNIQDFFNRAGVEIMSPHYMATRDGNECTIPKDYRK